MQSRNVLLLPGWQNSGPDHWQSLWEAAHGYTRVVQHDWMRPLRGDWIARLEEVLLGCSEPAVLVAHSLGCIQVAAWATHSQNTHRVKAALLVAPPETDRDDLRQMLPGWSPVPLQRLPFHSVLIASGDDPFCSAQRARQLADAWGARLIAVGEGGHLNAESGLLDWPPAHGELLHLMTIQT